MPLATVAKGRDPRRGGAASRPRRAPAAPGGHREAPEGTGGHRGGTEPLGVGGPSPLLGCPRPFGGADPLF